MKSAFAPKLLATWLVIPLIVALDYVTKQWIIDRYYLWEVDEIFGEIVRLTYVRNTGAAFGIAQGYPNFFKNVTILALIGITVYKLLTASRSVFYHLALSCIISGASGNLIDRFRHEFVVDFIDIGYGTLRWPSFNVADMSISTGVIILLLLSFLEESRKKSEPAVDPTFE